MVVHLHEKFHVVPRGRPLANPGAPLLGQPLDCPRGPLGARQGGAGLDLLKLKHCVSRSA